MRIGLLRARRLKYGVMSLLMLGGLLSSCSVEKNTAAVRNYHNLTSHYNIYFNGLESYKEGVRKTEESFQDDFTQLLPLFLYEEESVNQSIAPQMKRAMDKATKVITFHSITAKPKMKRGVQSEKDKAFYDKTEYNKWVDDCYLLIGMAYMQQGEYFLASESFKHIIRTFPEEDIHLLAMIWQVRAYSVLGELDYAEEMISDLQEKEIPKEYKAELHTAMADFHVRKGAYGEAAENLKEALEGRVTRSEKIRYSYILAQLYSEEEMGDESLAYFKKVIKLNPPYEMTFNAQVSMAEAFQSGSGNSNEIVRLLRKMEKDSKNKEYLDQIYFALGNIAMEEGRNEEAIDYYHESVTSSVQNSYQKGQSCLTLADIYYARPEYTLSAAYYDTAVTLLQEDYLNYNTYRIRSRSLNGLVGNIRQFELQDSLQRLALMPEVERFAVVDKIIEEIRKAEEEARRRELEEKQELQYAMAGSNDMNTGSSREAGGKWYFYNLAEKSFGQPEFRMKWGDRKLEDNWRRANKQTISISNDELGLYADLEGEGETATSAILDRKSREYYLKDIPMTDSAMDISDKKLEEALYQMGIIYKNELLDYQKAIDALLELVTRYEDGDYTMSAHYYLYELYNTIQESTLADRQKLSLSQKYPDSHMAKLLNNPSYIDELEAEEAKVENFYSKVFELYKLEDYRGVLREANSAETLYAEEEDMLMRLAYLKAMSSGAVYGKEVMKSALDSILAHYPGTEIALEAQEVIDYMYVAFPVIKEADQVKEAVALYTYNPDSEFYFVLGLKQHVDYNVVNFNLLNYNLDNFNTYDLSIENQLLNDYNVLIVKDFASMDAVSRYMNRVVTDLIDVVGEMPSDDYKTAFISKDNYSKLLEAKEFVPYQLFYRDNYTP